MYHRVTVWTKCYQIFLRILASLLYISMRRPVCGAQKLCGAPLTMLTEASSVLAEVFAPFNERSTTEFI